MWTWSKTFNACLVLGCALSPAATAPALRVLATLGSAGAMKNGTAIALGGTAALSGLAGGVMVVKRMLKISRTWY